MTTEAWPSVDRDDGGQMTCPIPGCTEALYLDRAYWIPLIAEQDDHDSHTPSAAVCDSWEVKCVAGHVIYDDGDQARATGGYESCDIAPEYDHMAIHKVVRTLSGERP